MNAIINHLQRLSLYVFSDEIPDYVKSASLHDIEVTNEHDIASYADNDVASLPIHTKAATFLSSVIFEIAPEHYGTQAGLVSSKLAAMRELFEVDEADVKRTAAAVRSNFYALSPDEAEAKLAKLATSVAFSTHNPGDLVRAARKFASMSVDGEFVKQWSFNTPRKGIKQAMLALANEYGNAEAKKIAAAADRATHDRAQEMIPELLDNIDLTRIGTQQVHQKLASLSELEQYDCRICDYDYPDATIRSKIGELAFVTNLDIVGKFLNVPTAKYRETLQNAPRDVQRLAQNCLS